MVHFDLLYNKVGYIQKCTLLLMFILVSFINCVLSPIVDHFCIPLFFLDLSSSGISTESILLQVKEWEYQPGTVSKIKQVIYCMKVKYVVKYI